MTCTSVCYKVSRVPQSNLSDLIYRLKTEVQRNEMTAQDQGQVIKDNHPNTGLATQKHCFCRSPPPGTNILSSLAGGSAGLYTPGKQCQNDQRQTGCHPRAGKWRVTLPASNPDNHPAPWLCENQHQETICVKFFLKCFPCLNALAVTKRNDWRK